MNCPKIILASPMDAGARSTKYLKICPKIMIIVRSIASLS